MIPELLEDHAPSQTTAGFWEAAGRGVLAIQTCEHCGHAQHPPRPVCSSCVSLDLVFVPSAGVGTVYSYTVVERGLIPELRGSVPYVLALVDLLDGPRMMALLLIDPARAAIGAVVRVTFLQVTPEVALPVFQLDEEG